MQNVKILTKRTEPVNRAERKKCQKELDWYTHWYIDEVIPLEHEFWQELQLAGATLSGLQYNDVFDRFRDKYISLRDKANHTKIKFRFIEADPFYWDKLYKPLEGK